MSSLRESPMRPRPSRSMPTWLIVVLAVVAVLVVAGVGYAIVTMMKGSSEPETQASASAPACITSTSIPQETLPRAKKVSVVVLNATKREGLARTAADSLSDAGFKVKDVGNDTEVRKQTGVAELRYGPKARQQALLLQYYLPGAELVPLDRKGKVVDVALGEAFTSVASQAEVDLALQTPVITETGPGCPTPSASPSVTGLAETASPSPTQAP